MPTVKELKDAIRGFKNVECPLISKMKKSDLIAFVIEKGIMTTDEANAGRKASSKPRKPRANKIVKVGEVKKARVLSEWNKFIKEHRKPGVSFADLSAKFKEMKTRMATPVGGELAPRRLKPKVAPEAVDLPVRRLKPKVAPEVVVDLPPRKIKKPKVAPSVETVPMTSNKYKGLIENGKPMLSPEAKAMMTTPRVVVSEAPPIRVGGGKKKD